MSIALPLAATNERPPPFCNTNTTPAQKNEVPRVATSDGMPTLTTIQPLSQPARIPAARQASRPKKALPVRPNTAE